MTEEQVKNWTSKRDAAKKIKDPESRAAALDIVYDMKDDMQLDCQRKMADRIKALVQSDAEQSAGLADVRESVAQIEKDFKSHVEDFDADHETVQEIRESRLRASGALLLLKWLGYIAAAGGGGLLTWLYKAAAEAQ